MLITVLKILNVNQAVKLYLLLWFVNYFLA